MLTTRHILIAGVVLTFLFVLTLVGMAWVLPAPADATDWWTAAGGAATALATIGLVVATGLLWTVTREGAVATAQSAQAAERAAGAAERAAIAAEQAHTAAQETAKRQLRAYLFLEPDLVIKVLASGVVKVDFSVKNSGQTPAANFWFDQRVEVIQRRKARGAFQAFDRVDSTGTSTLGPDRVVECMFDDHPLSEADAAALKAGDKDLLVTGCLFYEDVFGDRQHTNFSCRVSYNKSGQRALDWASDGNDAT